MSALLSVIAASRRRSSGITLGWEPVQKLIDAPYADDLVETEGVLVSSQSLAAAVYGTLTVNGVPFYGGFGPPNFSSWGNTGHTYYFGSNLSTAFVTMLSFVNWCQDNPPASLVISGLTVGKTYVIQLIAGVYFGDQVFTMTLQGSSVTGFNIAEPQSYVCRFVATGTTELITMTKSGSPSYAYFGLHGMQLRQLD